MHTDSLRCILRIPESIGSLMGLILFLLPNSIVIRHPTHELTLLVKILVFSLMKILLSRLFQHSGSTPHQKSTSQPLSGGILGTLRHNFPELSPLLGTGMTGLKSTSGISGRTGAEENRSRYPQCWSQREIYSRSNETYGVPTPLSAVSIWWTTLKGNFSLIKLPQSGLQVAIDAMTLSALSNCTFGAANLIQVKVTG